MLLKMRPTSPKLAMVARELALRLIERSFPPDAIRTPGVAHVIAAKLSRVFAPGGGGTVPKGLHPALSQAEQTVVRTRCDSMYKAYKHSPPDGKKGK